ncbi:MAG: DUF1565 domain-containing protein, partial [Methylococcales bacterium]|nr:DUF1565 domain-containing protein [Methylococcales bacterium]
MIFRKLLLMITGLITGLVIVLNVASAETDSPSLTTYYVATTGNDANPGTLAQPWATVQHAATTAVAGDTVLVRGGSYGERVTIANSGTAGNIITFKNYPDETPILDGTSVTVPGSDNGLFLIDSKNYIRIEGVELRNYTTSNEDRVPVGIFVVGSAHHIDLIDNLLHHIETNGRSDGNAHGIAVYGSDPSNSIHDIMIDGNELRDMKLGNSEAMVLNGNVEQFTVQNNSVHDNDNIGIDLIGFEGTASDPLVDQARDGVVRDNVVYNIDTITNPAYGGERSAA